MSNNFSRGFWRRAGQNTADRLSNAIFGDNWAKPVKHIRAESVSRRQNLKEQAHLNSVHEAVLANADAVRSVSFDDDVQLLAEQVNDMAIQLKAEGWKNVIGIGNGNEDDGKENRIHNKFTNTLFSKYKRGLTILERQDPFNRDIWFLKWICYSTRWRKFIGQYWPLMIFLCVFPILAIVKLWEWCMVILNSGNIWHIILFWLCITCLVLIRIYIAFFHQINALISRAHKKSKEKKSQLIKEAEQSQELNNIEEDIPVDNNTIMQVEHDYLWGKYGTINNIMKRGYKICQNITQKDILIVGYNPKYNTDNSIDNLSIYPLPEDAIINQLLVSPQKNLRYKTAYIDLFSFQESDHQFANQQIVLNPQLFGYVVEQICLTQNMIEEIIKPKLIIILNQDSWAYFGKLPQCTWMGYEFKTIKSVKGFELCEITGFSKAKDRISQDTRFTSNLVGTKVLFADGLNPDYYPTADEILEILQ